MNPTSNTYGIVANHASRDSKPYLKFSIQLQQNVDCESLAIRVMERNTCRPDKNVWHGDTEGACADEVLS